MTLEHISTIQKLKELTILDVPVCPKCEIERFRLVGRNSEVARCPECIKKLTNNLEWVKCLGCNEEWSYLGESRIDVLNNSVSSVFDVDYKRLSETSICIKCHNLRVGKAWSEFKSIQKEEFENKRQDRYKEILDR